MIISISRVNVVLGVLIVLAMVSFTMPATHPEVLDYPSYFGGRYTIPEDNPTTKEGVELGRFLFYEPQLSRGNVMSCASCHQQRLAFTDARRVSQGADGTLTKRNSMSLANLLWVRNFFWDGRASGLEAQALFPLTDPHEMGQSLVESVSKLKATPLYLPMFESAFGTKEITGERITKALGQFERTLISSHSKYDHYLQGVYQPTAPELRGMNLFMTPPSPERKIRGANCGHCHGTPKTFMELFHDNGLDSIYKDRGRGDITHATTDAGRFRVPTLRNIALTAPYMHDGRFNSLSEVLDHYNEHVSASPNLSGFIKGTSNEVNGQHLSLSTSEKADIIQFLHMLTDSVFITDRRFSNPHAKRN